MPNEALDKTIVGALDLFPANELIPTKRKDPIVPIKAAAVACLNEIPNPKKKAPYERASNDTFAPAQGQNKEWAFPDRSDSAITLGPLISRSNTGIFTFYLF
jgi:hypothetical protein